MQIAKRIFWTITTIISLSLFCWVGVSYIDVISKNCSENPQYCEYNFFSVLEDYIIE